MDSNPILLYQHSILHCGAKRAANRGSGAACQSSVDLRIYAAALAEGEIERNSTASCSRTSRPICRFQQLTIASLKPPGGIECLSGGLSS